MTEATILQSNQDTTEILGKIRKRGGGCGLVIEGLCRCCVKVLTSNHSAQWWLWLASSVHLLVPTSFKCRRNKPKYSGRIFQFGILFTFYILFSNANCVSSVSSTCNNCCYHSNTHLIYISTQDTSPACTEHTTR